MCAYRHNNARGISIVESLASTIAVSFIALAATKMIVSHTKGRDRNEKLGAVIDVAEQVNRRIDCSATMAACSSENQSIELIGKNGGVLIASPEQAIANVKMRARCGPITGQQIRIEWRDKLRGSWRDVHRGIPFVCPVNSVPPSCRYLRWYGYFQAAMDAAIAAGPIPIRSEAEFVAMTLGNYYRLETDLDGALLSSVTARQILLDGNGHTIRNVHETLFGLVEHSMIWNLRLENANSNRPLDRSGALALVARGACFKDISVEGGLVVGRSGVGGLVGEVMTGFVGGYHNDTRFDNVYTNVSVQSAPSNGTWFGGLIGRTWGSIGGGGAIIIRRSRAVGDITVSNLSTTAGGLVGQVGVHSDVKILQSEFDGVLTGQGAVGGIVGTAHRQSTLEMHEVITGGTITACPFTSAGGLLGKASHPTDVAPRVWIEDSFSRADLTSIEVAGIAVEASAVIERTYFAGTLSHCGPIPPRRDGGIVRIAPPPHTSVVSSYWDIPVSGTAVSGGGAGRATADMYNTGSSTTYTGWSFGTTWLTCPGTYPSLDWRGCI